MRTTSTSSSAEASAAPAEARGEPAGHWARRWYEGRRVLVTGGTSGIGAAIAAEFVAAGAEVTATGVTEAELEAARSGPLGRAQLARLDVTDAEAVTALVATFEALDVVVNCAGTIRRHDELAPDVFAHVVDVNLTGTMRVCAAARPLLAESAGAIVNTASMLSTFGGGLVPAYAASKGGIVQLTRSLAIAYADDGIRVNAIAPGWIRTALTDALQRDEARASAILSRTALKRWGEAGDLVGGVLYLCAPIAAFVTGAVLTIDGGYSVV